MNPECLPSVTVDDIANTFANYVCVLDDPTMGMLI